MKNEDVVTMELTQNVFEIKSRVVIDFDSYEEIGVKMDDKTIFLDKQKIKNFLNNFFLKEELEDEKQ